LRNIDRRTFVDLASSRTDLSKQDINRTDQLEDGLETKLVKEAGQRFTGAIAQSFKICRSRENCLAL